MIIPNIWENKMFQTTNQFWLTKFFWVVSPNFQTAPILTWKGISLRTNRRVHVGTGVWGIKELRCMRILPRIVGIWKYIADSWESMMIYGDIMYIYIYIRLIARSKQNNHGESSPSIFAHLPGGGLFMNPKWQNVTPWGILEQLEGEQQSSDIHWILKDRGFHFGWSDFTVAHVERLRFSIFSLKFDQPGWSKMLGGLSSQVGSIFLMANW